MPTGEAGFRNAAGAYAATFPRTLGGWTEVEREGTSLGFRLRGGRDAAGIATGSGIVYAGALPGVTVRYATTAAGVKEKLVLQRRGTAERFAFDVAVGAGASLERRGEGFVLRDAHGRAGMTLPPAFMVDAAGTAKAVPMRLTGSGANRALVLDPSDRWLRRPRAGIPSSSIRP